MDLELATTDDMLEELHQRSVRFVFAGAQNRNDNRESIDFACQGESRREILNMIGMLYDRVETAGEIDLVE